VRVLNFYWCARPFFLSWTAFRFEFQIWPGVWSLDFDRDQDGWEIVVGPFDLSHWYRQ